MLVVIFSIAIAQWLQTDQLSSNLKLGPIIRTKNLAQAEELNNLISRTIQTNSTAFNTYYNTSANVGSNCAAVSNSCLRYIASSDINLCTPPFIAPSTGFERTLNGKNIVSLACNNCNNTINLSNNADVRILTCVSDQDGKNVGLSVLSFKRNGNDLILVQDDSF